MAGRFPLYTDADVLGQIVEALIRRGWDGVRAVDLYPEGTDDHVHFERAVREGRVLVGPDEDQELIALSWVEEGRAFPGPLALGRNDPPMLRKSDPGLEQGISGRAGEEAVILRAEGARALVRAARREVGVAVVWRRGSIGRLGSGPGAEGCELTLEIA